MPQLWRLRPRREIELNGRKLAVWVLCAAVAGAGEAAAQATGDYATDLGRVYGAYQRLLATKEACDTAAPGTRPANEKAYAAWRTRHGALIGDLQRRVVALIRLASKDEKDYAKNIGKYEGSILQERQEYRDTLLSLGAGELEQQCRRWPVFLASPEADFGKAYAAEFETIRKRK